MLISYIFILTNLHICHVSIEQIIHSTKGVASAKDVKYFVSRYVKRCQYILSMPLWEVWCWKELSKLCGGCQSHINMLALHWLCGYQALPWKSILYKNMHDIPSAMEAKTNVREIWYLKCHGSAVGQLNQNGQDIEKHRIQEESSRVKQIMFIKERLDHMSCLNSDIPLRKKLWNKNLLDSNFENKNLQDWCCTDKEITGRKTIDKPILTYFNKDLTDKAE